MLPEHVLFVAVTTSETPHASDEDRVAVTPISDGLARAEVRYGFMEQPNIPEARAAVGAKRLARPLIATKPSLVDRQSAGSCRSSRRTSRHIDNTRRYCHGVSRLRRSGWPDSPRG